MLATIDTCGDLRAPPVMTPCVYDVGVLSIMWRHVLALPPRTPATVYRSSRLM